MKRAKLFITWFLIASMVIDPFVFNIAAWAQENAAAKEAATITEQGNAQVQDAAKTLNSTKEAKKSKFMSKGDKKKVDEANKALKDAKTQVNDVKGTAENAVGNVKEIGNAIKGDGSTLEKLTAVKAAAQKALISIGKLLQGVGKLLASVGEAIISIADALSDIPFIGSIAKALKAVGKTLMKVAGALTSAGKSIEDIGQKAADTDQKFSDIINQISTSAKNGWKDGGNAADNIIASGAADVAAQKRADTTKNVNEGTVAAPSTGDATQAQTGTKGEFKKTAQPDQ